MHDPSTSQIERALREHPRVPFLQWPTPLEALPRLGAALGVELQVKRDDLTGIVFGGNKVRKLEFYFGQALQARSDAVLVTGAVQSNYVRVVAACAARLGMVCHVQLEERVCNVDTVYRRSGNVLLDELLGATLHFYPVGNDEEGADRALHAIAADLATKGHRPFVIPLGASHPPLGALGYVRCAAELMDQTRDFDTVVVASGSGQTHAGLLFGLRARGWSGTVEGVCVRRSAAEQKARVLGHCARLASLLDCANPIRENDVKAHDDVLAPGYGIMNEAVAEAIRDCARLEGLLVDPVYTARAMAMLFALARSGKFREGQKVVFLHTGGLPALFAYETALRREVIGEPCERAV